MGPRAGSCFQTRGQLPENLGTHLRPRLHLCTYLSLVTLCCFKYPAALYLLCLNHFFEIWENFTALACLCVRHGTLHCLCLRDGTLHAAPISDPATLERELRCLFYLPYLIYLLTGRYCGPVYAGL